MIGNRLTEVPSIVPGSNVWTNRTVELIKLGHMFAIQEVFLGLTIGSTKDFLFDLSAITAHYLVLYEFSFKVTQGKAIATFYEKGDYSGGTVVPIHKKNENTVQTPLAILTETPSGTTIGLKGSSYLTGTETQGITTGGGGTTDKDFPTEINPAYSRLLRIIQSDTAGTFDLELRMIFAEIP